MPKKWASPKWGKIAVATGPSCPRVQGLSTGQAARFCYVTSETILNWIRSNRLRAQRTAGGQHRVLLEDLRSFMIENGMDTALLDAEKDVRPYCWEFHCRITSRYGSPSQEVCEDCLVHRSGTLNCWELHGLLPVTRRRFDACADCGYHRTWRRSKGEDE
jgi:excisionase family DNA binding protein